MNCNLLTLDRVRFILKISADQIYEVDKNFIVSKSPASLCSRFLQTLYGSEKGSALARSIKHAKSPLKLVKFRDVYHIIVFDPQYDVARLKKHIHPIKLERQMLRTMSKLLYLAIPAFLIIVGGGMLTRSPGYKKTLCDVRNMAPLNSQKKLLQALQETKEILQFINNTNDEILSKLFQQRKLTLEKQNVCQALIPAFSDNAERIEAMKNFTWEEPPDMTNFNFGDTEDYGKHRNGTPPEPTTKGTLVFTYIFNPEYYVIPPEKSTIQIYEKEEKEDVSSIMQATYFYEQVKTMTLYDTFKKMTTEIDPSLISWVEDANVVMQLEEDEYVPIPGLLHGAKTQRHNIVYSRPGSIYDAYRSAILVALSDNKNVNVILTFEYGADEKKVYTSVNGLREEFKEYPVNLYFFDEFTQLNDYYAVEFLKNIIEAYRNYDVPSNEAYQVSGNDLQIKLADVEYNIGLHGEYLSVVPSNKHGEVYQQMQEISAYIDKEKHNWGR
jgi:hypothetical protein